MKHFVTLVVLLALSACGAHEHEPASAGHAHEDAHADEAPRGPHGGRILSEGPFAVELAIFETGVPPEYHAWPTLEGKPLPLSEVDLTVELTRLDGTVDRFTFEPQQDYLRGSGVVTEPHSFEVKVLATYAGKRHEWSYDNFEGRTTIASDIAEASGIVTETAGPAMLVSTVKLYGRITVDPSRERKVSARFPGVIHEVTRQLGDTVRAGETLAVIESNESLRRYNVTAPISGLITERNANPGEQSGERALFTVVDPSAVLAELAVFPADRARVRPGTPVTVRASRSDVTASGKVDRIGVHAAADQSVTALVRLDNERGEFLPGAFVTADVQVGTREVPLAVKSVALQPFRDFTVVFERIGDTYEVRMLELGETQGEWAEVLGGLKPGARYVTENSYLIKADVEKSGAAHDH